MRSNHHLTLKDEEIIAKIRKENNPQLFETLYTRYYRRVMDKSYSLLKDKALAEDATRDILSKAFEKLDQYKGQSTFSSWLYSITYNHCIDFLRLKKRLHYPEWNKNHDIPEIVDDAEEEFPDISYDHLEMILEMIHPEEKTLLLMRYEHNLSFKQIGMSLRISESAAKMRIKRAKARVLYHFKDLMANMQAG